VNEQIRPNAMHVLLVPNQKKAVRNVPNATLVKQVLDPMVLVINVLRVNTVRAVWNRLRAMHAQLVGRLRMEVQNVIRAMLADLAKQKVFVQHVRMVFIKRTKAKQNAASATLENRTSMPKQHAVVVTLVHLVAGMAFVRHARLGSIKIPKVNKNAATFVPRPEKYPTIKARGVNCPRGVLAKWANI